jgi:23S rRNA (adenine2503-C2)-methyltransferase
MIEPAKKNIRHLSLGELEQYFETINEKKFRAKQVYEWLWLKQARSFDAMTNLSKELRNNLSQKFSLPALSIDTIQNSADGTIKSRFITADGHLVEGVLIPTETRLTACVSSQIGCSLTCRFCATGYMDRKRNLEFDEIYDEVALINEQCEQKYGKKLSNIVFMGMGEPLMNWKAVDPTLTILNDENGFGIGARHITVSTVGVLPGIVALGERREQFRLAISIHAPSDALRHTLMPINTKYPLAQVIEAARVFDRRVTFEYVMLHGVNDAPEHAKQLAALAKRCKAFVNLIPLHAGGAGNFVPTTPQAFARLIRAQGVEVAIRKSRGKDIAAACGQLRVERQRRRSPVTADKDSDVQVA